MEQVIVFIFGTIIGSFLNVLILRYGTGQSIIRGGSRCFSCGKKLKWHELIPVISFIIQGGKCRECKSRISWQYPIVEILTGIIFLLIFNLQLSIFKTIYLWTIFSVLIIIAVYDLRHQIIPDKFVYTFIVLSLFYLIFENWDLFGNWKLIIGNSDLLWRILAGPIFFSFFGALWLASRGAWMGFGDAKLALGIGWFLGLEKGIWALLLAFWAGAIIGIFLMIFFRKCYNLKSSVPFGPFLVLGALLAFIFNSII